MLQLFGPRWPFLTDQIPGFPFRDIWLNGLIGVFGWVDYGFGPDVRARGMRVVIGLTMLCLVALIRNSAAVSRQWRLLLCALIGLLGVLGAVGTVDYQAAVAGTARFEQARYLLPLLALYAAVFGVGAKALGPRLGRLILPALWVLVALHTFAAMALTANRYYL